MNTRFRLGKLVATPGALEAAPSREAKSYKLQATSSKL